MADTSLHHFYKTARETHNVSDIWVVGGRFVNLFETMNRKSRFEKPTDHCMTITMKVAPQYTQTLFHGGDFHVHFSYELTLPVVRLGLH